MWIGEAIWLCLAASGASYIAQSFHTVFVILKYLGVAYLLYLAWKMWTAPTTVKEGDLPTEDSPWRLFATGMAITLGNPKIMVFYLALLPSLIDLSGITVLGIAELVAVMMLVLIVVDLAWVTAAAQARRWLRSSRAMRIANRVSATAMGGAAIAIAAK
jgi:threonine/homoserine/homoserine lactone efflux protein